MRPAQALIDLAALRHNYQLARQCSGGKALAVVKADAYGHGAVICAQALQAEAGSDKAHILSLTIYLKDMADYAAMNAVWDAWVAEGAAPGRACVEAKLYDPRVLVEMMVVAAQR